MIDRLFSNDTLAILQKSLDAGALQQKVISNNLANVDIPGFKRSEVIFQDKLRAALDQVQQATQDLPAYTTHPNHIPFEQVPTLESVEPTVLTHNETSLRNDKNNVDIDLEMAYLAENSTYYNALAQLTNMHFAEIKSAIRGTV